MSLRTIVEILGGDLYDRGRRANIPAPGHSRADRSVSLLLENDRVVVHTFGDGDWRAVLDHLRAHGLIDARNAPLSIVAARRREPPAAASIPERRDAALRLWEGGRPIDGTPSQRYCRGRGVRRDLPGPEILRHNPQAPVSAYRRRGFVRPALLAAIRAADGGFSAVEITYLTPQGRRAHDLRLPRKTIGLAPGGCAIRLDAPGPEMLVGEGLFTTLSAGERFGLPAWALMSARNLRAWTPPEGVRAVLIAADRGEAGEAAAEQLRTRLAAAGVAVAVALPPAPWGDWNDWLMGARPKTGVDAAAG
jgi:putative DNA primase/helicase